MAALSGQPFLCNRIATLTDIIIWQREYYLFLQHEKIGCRTFFDGRVLHIRIY